MRILLVEDDPDAAEILSILLVSEGYEVRVADNAFSALRELERFRPAIALVDIGLPIVNGYELARRIQARARCGLIAVSSWPPPIDGSHTAYFDHYVVKPIDFASLREALVTLGRKYR